MPSSNENIFRITGHLCGEFIGPRPVTRSFDVFFLSAPEQTTELTMVRPVRRHRAHCDVIVMCRKRLISTGNGTNVLIDMAFVYVFILNISSFASNEF